MKKVLSILLGTALVVLFGGTLYFLWAKSQKPPVVFATQSPARADIVKKAVATGSVVPRREVEIKPQVSGIIDELAVEAGAMVSKGDLIARIRLVPDMVTLNNAQSRVNRARIDLELAAQEHERNQRLFADGTIPLATFQEVDSALKSAREELEAAVDNLDLVEKGTSRKQGNSSNTLVRSTMAGTVLEVPVEVGNSVIEANTFNAGTTLAIVADMSDMIFEGFVDESEVGKLQPGMKLVLTIGALAEERIDASLEHIAPKGVEENGAIQFEIRAAVLPRADLLLRANYSANADVVLDRRDAALAIPESLLQFDGDKPYVEVETAPQVFERREIVTGLSDGIMIEIVSGLTEADKVKAGEQQAGAAGQRPGRSS